MVALWVQKAINKIHLFSLAITCACPYHNPTVTTGQLIHNVDISKLLSHTTAIHLVKWKLIFLHEENTCIVPDAIKCDVSCESASGRHQQAWQLPWDGFWQIVQKFCGYVNRLLQQLSGWLVSDGFGGEAAWWGVLECGYRLSGVLKLGGCILWNPFGDGLWQRDEHPICRQKLCCIFVQ